MYVLAFKNSIMETNTVNHIVVTYTFTIQFFLEVFFPFLP